MISIVMTVYNGEKYLEEQLLSLGRQTLLPDELVIGDDGSTDGTEELIRRTARMLPFPVRYEKNPERLGYAENFRRTACRAAGDILFFCDQDDVWKRNKLARMTSVLEDHPEILVLVSSFWLTDAAAGRMRLTMDQMLSGMADIALEFSGKADRRQEGIAGTAAPEKIFWEQYLRHPRYPGMTMAVRRKLWRKASALPWPEKAAHDWMVCELAAEEEGLYRIPDRLVFYRQHGDNTTGTAGDRRGDAAVLGRTRLLETMAEEAEVLCRRETLAPLEQKKAAGHGAEAEVPGTADAGRKRIACRTAEMLRKRTALLQQPFRFSSMMRILFFDLSHLDCMTMQSLCGDLVCFLRKRF